MSETPTPENGASRDLLAQKAVSASRVRSVEDPQDAVERFVRKIEAIAEQLNQAGPANSGFRQRIPAYLTYHLNSMPPWREKISSFGDSMEQNSEDARCLAELVGVCEEYAETVEVLQNCLGAVDPITALRALNVKDLSARLKADPDATLKEIRMQILPGMTIAVDEATQTIVALFGGNDLDLIVPLRGALFPFGDRQRAQAYLFAIHKQFVVYNTLVGEWNRLKRELNIVGV